MSGMFHAIFQALQVDEVMPPRASHPAQSPLTHLSDFNVPWMSTTAGGQRKPTQEKLTTLKYKPEDLGALFQKGNAEITLYYVWDEFLRRRDRLRRGKMRRLN